MIAAGLHPIDDGMAEHLAMYGNLILKWNARTNLTAISDPDTLLQRHLVESVGAAQAIPAVGTLLDYGTGAGLPGIPIALCRPEIAVTLAESQGKKISFLREVVRSLDIAPAIHAGRVEAMPASMRFDVVTLRAVDGMEDAIRHAQIRVVSGGWLGIFTTEASEGRLLAGLELTNAQRVKLPTAGSLLLIQGPFVPRGTKS